MSKSYDFIKNRYSDLLDPNDIKNAFKEDAEYLTLLQNIGCKRFLYSFLWVSYIIIFSIVVAILTKNQK
jgi:hypothetical protein